MNGPSDEQVIEAAAHSEGADEELKLVIDLLENRAKLCANVGDDNSARELRDAIERLWAKEHRE